MKILEGKLREKILGKSEMVYEMALALGVKDASSSKSNYEVVTIPDAGETTIRISNHSANPAKFGATDNNVGIVIKTSNNNFREKDDVDYVEFMYYGDKVAGDGERQRRIVEGLRPSGAYSTALEGLGDGYSLPRSGYGA